MTKSIDFDKVLAEAAEYSDKRLRPNAGRFDQEENLPGEIIKEMADMGFLGAPIPVEYGGLGMDPVNYGRLTKAIGKGCSSARAVLTVHTSLVSQTVLKWGTKNQKNKYLPKFTKGEKIGCFALSEPDCGSDANSVRSTYVKEGKNFIINGKKKWITLGEIADVYLLIASKGQINTAFLVDAQLPGIKAKKMTGLIGNRGAHIAEIEFSNVKVPANCMLGNEGEGFNFIANTALFYGRYSIAWGGLAIAKAALEEMSSYVKSREQFGKKIGQFQLIQALIADAAVEVYAAWTLCNHVGKMMMDDSLDAVMEVNIAKQFTAKTAIKISADAIQVFGGNGCWNNYAVERLSREAKILGVIEGTHQIHQLMIGKYSIKRNSVNGHYDKSRLEGSV